MFNRNNIHLWIIGSASFLGFAYVEFNATRVDAFADPGEPNLHADGPAIDMVAAQELYLRRCGACHSLDSNRIGPRHRGVVGRQAGSLADYEYSSAMQRAAFVWDEKQLDKWLTNPEALVPGQKMGFRLSSADERKIIIAYLKAAPE